MRWILLAEPDGFIGTFKSFWHFYSRQRWLLILIAPLVLAGHQVFLLLESSKNLLRSTRKKDVTVQDAIDYLKDLGIKNE